MASVATWAKVIEPLPDSERELILTNAHWLEAENGIARYIVPRLKIDRFIPEDAIRELFSLLLRATTLGTRAFWVEFRDWCSHHVLEGKRIWSSLEPDVVGRAVEFGEYATQLRRANPGVSLEEIKSLLLQLAQRKLSKRGRSRLESLFMSEFASWATWDVDSKGSKSPFAFATSNCADVVRAHLGLSRKYYRQRLFTFAYDAAEVPELMRPTSADARMDAQFWPPPEPPPPENDGAGWTRPWFEWPAPHPDGELEARYRPEAVHAKTTFPASIAAAWLKSSARVRR